MRKLSILWGISVCLMSVAGAQSPQVSDPLFFADMRLDLTNEAQKKIQTDVDALTRYEKYFNDKVKRIDAYFPLIEQILREEKVPEDIKYLVIQESALVGDAVSSSNAVGYWQFKIASAREVGLTIDASVDERMNIITATRGAARYFKNNNALFDNWLHALMAYYEGPGGALKKADKSYNGKKQMRLDGKTHWYLLKYLAHKIAFEGAVGKDPNPPVQLLVYRDGGGQTLREIADQFGVTEDDLQPYNTWLKQKKVPTDKTYPVIVPDFSRQSRAPLAAQDTRPTPSTVNIPKAEAETTSILDGEELNSEAFPAIGTRNRWGNQQLVVNGIPGIIAKEGDDVKQLARRAGVPPSQIIKFNDLANRHAEIVPGKPYYIKSKRNRAVAHYHVAEADETWWDVSQRFGIKLKKLLRNNRLRDEQPLQAHQVLWLRYIRPKSVPVEFKQAPVQPVEPALADRNQPSTVDDTSPSTMEASTTLPSDPSAESAWRNTPSDETSRPQATGKAVSDAARESVFHTVKPKESLYSIARKYRITAAELAGHNRMSVYETLQVGQQLQIPQTAQAEEVVDDYHEVRAGETMYQIAREYQISMRDLMEWNRKENFDLSVGEQLRVAPPSP